MFDKTETGVVRHKPPNFLRKSVCFFASKMFPYFSVRTENFLTTCQKYPDTLESSAETLSSMSLCEFPLQSLFVIVIFRTRRLTAKNGHIQVLVKL